MSILSTDVDEDDIPAWPGIFRDKKNSRKKIGEQEKRFLANKKRPHLDANRSGAGGSCLHIVERRQSFLLVDAPLTAPCGRPTLTPLEYGSIEGGMLEVHLRIQNGEPEIRALSSVAFRVLRPLQVDVVLFAGIHEA